MVRKESIGGSRSSVMGNEAITVTVSEFKAGKNAGFLKNKKIEKLFVEYRYYICVFLMKFEGNDIHSSDVVLFGLGLVVHHHFKGGSLLSPKIQTRDKNELVNPISLAN